MPGVPNRPAPAPPKINTTLNARGDADRRPARVNSTSTSRQTTTKSPVQSEMNAHNLKRPRPNHSRGNSPPEKRGRTGPPSPPRSRTGSGVGLPLATHAPAATYSPLHVQSPTSRSGASTPVHNAPPAPSMLPKSASLSVADKSTPATLATLQGLKFRKQAVFNASKLQSDDAASISTLTDQLKDKVSENVQLRDKLERMEREMQELSPLKGQMKDLQKRLDNPSNVAEFNKAASNNTAKFEIIINRLAKLESASASRPESDSLTEVKNNVENLQKWKDTQSAREDKELNDLKKLMQQELGSKLEKHGDVIRKEIGLKVEGNRQVLRTELLTAETRIKDKFKVDLEPVVQGMKTLTSRVAVLDAFRKDMERQNVPEQLNDLFDRATSVSAKEKETYDKLYDHIKDAEKYIGPAMREFELQGTTLVERVKKLGTIVGQVKTFQSELAKLRVAQEKLISGQDTFEAEKRALQARVTLLDKTQASLERKLNGFGPGFNKVGTSAVSPSTNATPAQDPATKTELKRLSDDIQVLQSSLAKTDDLRTQLVTFSEKIDTIEKQLPSLADKCAQQGQSVAALGDKLNGIGDISNTLNDIKTEIATLKELPSKVIKLEAHLGSTAPGTIASLPSDGLASLQLQLENLDADVKVLFEQLAANQVTTHQHAGMIKVLGEQVPSIFAQNMDPFKLEIRQTFEKLGHSLQTLTGNVTALEQQSQQARPTSSEEVAKLKEDILQLKTSRLDGAALRGQFDQEIASIRTTTDSAVAGLRHAFRVLQDQYNNITTDEVHGKMVNWFLQAYPSNGANMVQQFAVLRNDMQNLQDLFNRNTAQLEAKLEEVQRKNTGSADADILNNPTISAMREAIQGVQHSLQSLNSVASPFVPKGAFSELSKQVTELDDRMKSFSTEVDGRMKSFVTAAGKQHDMRVEAHAKLVGRVTKLESTGTGLRQDVENMRDILQPHRDILGSVGHMINLILAMQTNVNKICDNAVTKNGQTLKIEWPTPGDSAVDAAATDKGKGKK